MSHLPTHTSPKEEQGPGGTFRTDMLAGGSADGALEAPKRRVPFQLVLLAGIVVAAGGALYAMRMVGFGPVVTLADVVKIDYDVYDGVKVRDARTEALLADLTTLRASVQVPPESVSRNPFELAPELAPEETATGPDLSGLDRMAREAAERAKREREQRRQQIESSLDRMEINSVLMGSNPVVRISGKVYRVGDTVDKMFRVVAIENRAVELEVDGEIYVLSMDPIDPGN